MDKRLLSILVCPLCKGKLLYSKQLSFWGGANERDEGVYTQYMTDGERVCNKPENSSVKSIYEKTTLVCLFDRLAYPIRDGIPVMLEEEARVLSVEESDALRKANTHETP